MFLIIYSAVAVPVHIGFDSSATGYLWIFEASSSLIFITDLVFTFRTAYYEDGVWTRTPKLIAQRYMSGWFWIDAPSSVPVELIEVMLPADADAGHLSLLRFLRMFRLIRLLRLLKIGGYITSLEEVFDVSLKPLRVVSLVLKMTFVAHLLACAWYYIGNTAGSDEEVTWVTSYDDGTALDAPLSTKYLYSMYWSLTTLTTVGYGDITPTNDIERRFVTFALLIGSLTFAYILGDIGSLMQSLDRQNVLINERIDSVKEYLRWRGIPRDLGIRVRRYYEHFFTQRAIFDEGSILGELNPQLHSEVVQKILSGTLGKLPIFNLLDPDFRLALFPLLKPLSFMPGEVIFRKGDASRDLMFLLEGEVSRRSLTRTRLFTPCVAPASHRLLFLLAPLFLTPLFLTHLPVLSSSHLSSSHLDFSSSHISSSLLSPSQVNVLSSVDGVTPLRRMKRDEEQILCVVGLDEDGENELETISVDAVGCFGQSVLLGRRRRFTHQAKTKTQILLISKVDLEKLFASHHHRSHSRRLCNIVLKNQKTNDRLYRMADVLRIAMARRGDLDADAHRAALLIQYCWRRFLIRRSDRHDSLYKLIRTDHQPMGVEMGVHGDAAHGMMAAVLQRLEKMEAKQASATSRISDEIAELRRQVLGTLGSERTSPGNSALTRLPFIRGSPRA